MSDDDCPERLLDSEQIVVVACVLPREHLGEHQGWATLERDNNMRQSARSYIAWGPFNEHGVRY